MRLLILLLLLINTYVSATQDSPIIKNIIVGNVLEVYQAIDNAHKRHGYTNILFKDGLYSLPNTLVINAPAITLASLSGQRNKVVLSGNGMQATHGVDNLIYVAAPHFSLNGITLQQAGNHLIQISGSDNADYTTLSNCVLRDSYEQLFKVSDGGEVSADFGLVDNCLFEYSAGKGPQWYIGGIDAHGAKHWTIKGNTFKNIASPSKHIAEHAIHIWNKSGHNTVENNVIIDCDRGIGFGMQKRGNQGGIIKNNIIVHTDNGDPFADVGIILENSSDTYINNNHIYLAHSYPNAIEARFISTTNTEINNNVTNKRILIKDGAKASLKNNKVNQPKNAVIPDALKLILQKQANLQINNL